jgi:hypothetical protein
VKGVTSRGTFALRCEGAALQSAGCLGKYRPTLSCRAGTCPPYLAAPALQRASIGPRASLDKPALCMATPNAHPDRNTWALSHCLPLFGPVFIGTRHILGATETTLLPAESLP